MITEANNKTVKVEKEDEPKKPLTEKQKAEVLKTRYGIGKKAEHFGGNR